MPMESKKKRSEDYGGPERWPDGYGKQINPPDDRFIDEVVHPHGGRPSWGEGISESLVSPDGFPTATDRERQAREADAKDLQRSREFRVTEENVKGNPNNLWDEKE